MRGTTGLLLVVLIVLPLSWASTGRSVAGAQYVFTSQANFTRTLETLGLTMVRESFEDDAAWGHVRTLVNEQHTAPSVTNLGMIWTANNPNSEVTTGSGPAFVGQWGFFILPHGDPQNAIPDGFVGTANQVVYAIGGWMKTNTPPAGLTIILDGDEQNPVDFSGEAVDAQHRFFGVVDTDGFRSFEVRETEAAPPLELKYLFADYFSWGVLPADQPITLSHLWVPYGTLVEGDVTSLVASDDTYVSLATAPIVGLEMATCTMAGVAQTADIVQLDVTAELASDSDQALAVIRLFDFDVGSWQSVGAFALTPQDTARRVSVHNNPGAYIRNSDLRVLIQLIALGSSEVHPTGFTIRCDQLSLTVRPAE